MSTVKIGNWSRGLHTNALEKHRGLLDRMAKENGLDPTVLYAMANIESGFDANTGNKNYGGLFAIDKKQHAGKWQDPEYNTREAIKLFKANAKSWAGRFGADDEFTVGKAYLLHQQGAGGGTALYAARDTNKTAAEVLAPYYAARAKKAGMDPQAWVTKYVIQSNGGQPGMSARDFANMWINRADALQLAYAGKKWNPTQEDTAPQVAEADPKPQSTSRGKWVEITPTVSKPQVTVPSNRALISRVVSKLTSLFKRTR